MGKFGGLVIVAVVALTGCAQSSAPQLERAANVQPASSAPSDMLASLRPNLVALKASDAALVSEAYGACMTLVFRSKDAYREDVMSQYADVTLALDHLTVAAAAKQYLCR